METKINLEIPMIYQTLNEFETKDTRFLSVKIWLMHLGENFNGSYFEKEVVEDAIPSLANTPILCYVEDNSKGEPDFSDHRMIIAKEDGRYKFKYIGRSIGVIPETNNAKFEKRLCDDNIEREFLTVEGLIWINKWDDIAEIVNRDLVKPQSMELDDYFEGYNANDGYFHFTKFRFYGSCGLGEDYKPAMINSTIEMNFNYDSLRNEIQTKMEQFKLFMQSGQSSENTEVDINKQFSDKGEMTKLNEKQKLLAKYNLTEEQIDFSIEDYSIEDLKVKLDEYSESTNGTNAESTKTDVATTTENGTDFSATEDKTDNSKVNYLATYKEKYEALRNGVSAIESSNTYYYVSDFDDEYVYVHKYSWDDNGDYEAKGRFTYTIDDGKVSITGEFTEMFVMWLTAEEKLTIDSARTSYEQLSTDFETYKTEYVTKEEDVVELRNFKTETLEAQRTDAEKAIFEKFDSKLKDNTEYEALKGSTSDMSIEDIEIKCFAILGKSINFTANETEQTTVTQLNVDITGKKNKNKKPYGDIFAEYGKE